MNPIHWHHPPSARRRRLTTLQRSISPNPEQLPKGGAEPYSPRLFTAAEQMQTVREQLSQMGTTLETLTQVIYAVNPSAGPFPLQGATESDLMKNLQDLDFKQVMSLLQSPVVQNLIETLAAEEASKKKK
ncbi:hypothetical protein [Ammoniphilus sp. CFH 90114]|uniref:hypothetical protein n=1 Tax=Ammoniphilus sp. CFH 90114 TaxID=2493665 RepID=UPI00100FDDD6|nr:hypothetical protein [Ammoniphilus sp. CFH 90114]RXT13892.1 hypothetical protein EIZ39_07080 [Ammoniphilus sp. CFH 90114]